MNLYRRVETFGAKGPCPASDKQAINLSVLFAGYDHGITPKLVDMQRHLTALDCRHNHENTRKVSDLQ